MLLDSHFENHLLRADPEKFRTLWEARITLTSVRESTFRNLSHGDWVIAPSSVIQIQLNFPKHISKYCQVLLVFSNYLYIGIYYVELLWDIFAVAQVLKVPVLSRGRTGCWMVSHHTRLPHLISLVCIPTLFSLLAGKLDMLLLISQVWAFRIYNWTRTYGFVLVYRHGCNCSGLKTVQCFPLKWNYFIFPYSI